MRESNKFDHNLIRHLHRLEKEQPDDLAQTRLQVSVGYTGELRDLENSGLRVSANFEGIAIGDIAAGELENLARLENVRQISMEGPLGLHLDKSVSEIHADLVRNDPDTPYTGTGVVIGIIDSGIDIFHKNFRKTDGTSRVLSIWDQTISPPGTHPPLPFHTGAEFDANAIKNALDNPDQPFPHQDSLGHGTHVAGIAAGNGSQAGNCHGSGKFIGVAPEADLIAVKIVPDSNSTNRITNMLAAVTYIYLRTVRQNPPKPAVVSISVRAGIGPHDGTTHLESVIDQILGPSKGFAVVVSAGNDGRKGSDGDWQRGTYNAGFHSSKQIAAHGHVSIPLIVPPKRTASDNLEIWYSAGAGRLRVQVTDPTGTVAGPVAPGSPPAHIPLGSATVNITSTVNDPNNHKGQISISIDPPANGVIPAGQWSITLTETAGTAVSMDLWLINLEGHPTTVLDFPDREIATTVNAPGTARNVITVGAYASKNGELGEFSSRGPTLAPDNRQKPDICAPGYRHGDAAGITAPAANQRGGCCCDCCYDFYTEFVGTSQAAPHVAGVVALMLQKNSNLTFEQLRATIQTFRRKPDGVAPLPNNDWGFGKVDAQLATANIPPGSALTGDPVVTADAGDSGEIIVPTGSPSNETAELNTAKRRVEPFPRLRDVFRPSALRIGKALQHVADRGKGNPGAQMMMALISMHFDEVFALINRNRRVATKWHRMFGPQVLRHMLWNQDGSASLIPGIVQNQNVNERMRDLFGVLCRYGSAELRTDLDNYGDFLLAIPGAGFSELNTLPLSEIAFGPSRNT